MLQALQYPFDLATLFRKRNQIKNALLPHAGNSELRVAILGGATSAELRQMLELFLLGVGVRATFYESEYNRYYEDVMLDDGALRSFAPQIAFIYTSCRNIESWPSPGDSVERVATLAQQELGRFREMWQRLVGEHACTVIQANFDPPPQRASGHWDASAAGGRHAYVSRLNRALADAVAESKGVLLLDANQLCAQVGLDAWHSAEHWYSYKLPTGTAGTVTTAHALSRLIAGALGKASKCLVLDLDNTLWGGVIGDDGVNGLKLGQESALGEAYVEFQRYCLELKQRGVLLAVASKNDIENAKAGFEHPDTVLKLTDFSAFVANWQPKDENLRSIATQLNIGLDSLVFVDDNPAERALVREQLPDVRVPEVGANVAEFAVIVERNLFFERPELSAEDLKRSAYYAQDQERETARANFGSYDDYLSSLEMRAEIGSFSAAYLERVTQLTNKTNQFNLTTRRYTLPEMTAISQQPRYVTLYGRLADRFGDNGLVSVVVGDVREQALHIELWLMSCRVLKRSFEQAMLDVLVERARAAGAHKLVGYYYRTPKNQMVAEHYGTLGFELLHRADDGSASTWVLDVSSDYTPRNKVIKEIVLHG